MLGTWIAVAAGFVLFGVADDWPQFRGSGGAAIGKEAGLPTEWSAQKNIAWKAKIPGYGWSAPIVAGDRVFVTTAVAPNQRKPPGGAGFMLGYIPNAVHTWELHCLSAADGKTLWTTKIASMKPLAATNPTNGYATETPATDGERVVVVIGGIGAVFGFDMAGKEVWKAELGVYPTQFNHGAASSPAIDNGRVYLQCDNERKSFLLALDMKTGKEIWRTPRPERTSWCSPIVWKHGGRTEIVCVGNPRVRGYDAADGKQLWELGDLFGQVKATPIANEDVVVVGSGGGFDSEGSSSGIFGIGARKGKERPMGSRPLFAVKAGASGDVTLKPGEKETPYVAWHQPTAGPATASPLLYEGCLYVLDERGGLAACFDAKTGKRHYKERVPGARGFVASPWAYGGKVFCLDDSGTTHVLQPGPTFKVLGANPLDEMTWSSPAVAGGAVYLRTLEHLYCVREGAGGSAGK